MFFQSFFQWTLIDIFYLPTVFYELAFGGWCAVVYTHIVFEFGKRCIESWMERIQELCKGYEDKDIINMDESECFFKALPAKGLAQKGKKSKGGKGIRG